MSIKSDYWCCKNAPQSVTYNEFNGVVQCLSCGACYRQISKPPNWRLVPFIAIILLITLLVTALSTRGQSNTCNNGDALVINTGGSKNNQCIPLNQQPAGTGTTMLIANDTVTGTTVNRLAKLTGAPSKAVITSTSDTDGAIGIVTNGAGITGSATVTIIGQASCVFDGATTAGNYFIISPSSAGACRDAGSTFPTSGATYGRVLSTNVGAGTYTVELMTPDVAFQNAGNGKSRPGGSDTQVQFNDSGSFGGDSGLVFNKTSDLVTITTSAGGGLGTNGTLFVTLVGTPSTSLDTGGIRFSTNAQAGFTNSSSSSGTVDATVVRNAAGILSINNGSTGAGTFRWLKKNGQVRVTAQFDKTNTTLADVTGTPVALLSGQTWAFEFEANYDADITGGQKWAIVYSSTTSAIEYYVQSICDATNLFVITSRQTASGGSVGQVGCTAGRIRISGSLTTTGAGNLSVQFAQNASNGTSSVRTAGSFFNAWPSTN